ncbi:hypothetical protein LMG29739_00735 [Paraburkholderia solisilvae]|uniref:Uncharacterized protein n=1 Tax=Paraburkholderia solisilvae TaxID=624376 RepID=A0A6J5D8T8_9BURK|nr:hypothetical protein LMG29739_00735 [Paraburkholderia solisilvae]
MGCPGRMRTSLELLTFWLPRLPRLIAPASSFLRAGALPRAINLCCRRAHSHRLPGAAVTQAQRNALISRYCLLSPLPLPPLTASRSSAAPVMRTMRQSGSTLAPIFS